MTVNTGMLNQSPRLYALRKAVLNVVYLEKLRTLCYCKAMKRLSELTARHQSEELKKGT